MRVPLFPIPILFLLLILFPILFLFLLSLRRNHPYIPSRSITITRTKTPNLRPHIPIPMSKRSSRQRSSRHLLIPIACICIISPSL